MFLLNEGNIIRIFLLEFTSVSVILKLMFHDKEFDILFTLFCFLLFLFMLYLIASSYSKFIIANAETSSNYLGVCWFFQSNTIDKSKFIVQWIIHHKTICSSTKCDICLKLYETDLSTKQEEEDHKKLLPSNATATCPVDKEKGYSPYQFVMVLNDKRKKKNYLLTNHDAVRIDFILLTVLCLSTDHQLFRLYRTFDKLFNKYKNDYHVLLSLLISFEITCKGNKKIIKSYKLIKQSENLIRVMKDYIHYFNKFIHFEMKTPENFLNISKKFKLIKDDTKTIINIIKKDDKCNYQTRIVRFIYETVLRFPLKLVHNESEITASEDFLVFRYENDKYILLQYSIRKEVFTIIKGSKDILKYKGKQLDALFPDYLKKKGSLLFMAKLQNTNNNESKNMFSFVIKDLQQPDTYGFIQDFKMLYSIFPSNTGDEMLISINYMTDYNDILIFEISFEKEEEYLFSCSKDFLKLFGLSPEMLFILSKANHYISFSDLFTKQTFNFQNEGNICLFQYQKYAKTYRELLKCEGLNEAMNYKDIKDMYNKICDFENRKKELTFVLTEKFIEENAKKKYIVYNVTDLSKDKEIKKHREMSIDVIDNEIQNDPETKFNVVQATTAPTISGFSTGSCLSSSLNLSLKFQGRENSKYYRKEKSQQVRSFTFSILGFGLIIIIITLLFLILEVNQNSTFQSLFQLFQAFKYFKRHVECIPLSIVSNLCYENEDGTCKYYYENYASKIKEENSIMNALPSITDVINAEVSCKSNEVMRNFNIFLNGMHELNYDEINQVGTMVVNLNDIKIVNDKLQIETINTTFIDLIRTYNNYQTALVTTSSYKNERIKLMLINENQVITSENGSITEAKRNVYRLILNYPHVHKSILKSSSIIETSFQNALTAINSILTGFFFPLLVFHLLLCALCILFLRIFIQMLKTIIISIVTLLSNQMYLNFIDKRIESLKLLCELYKENPMKIVNRIQYHETDYKKKQKELHQTHKSEANPTQTKVDTPIKIENQIQDKEFDKIIIKYKIIIIVLFSVYMIYSVTYYIFINEGYLKLTYLVSYGSINTLIDNYIYDNVYSMQYIAITNTTPYDLSMKIYNDNSINYVKYGIDQLYTIIRNKEAIEKEHSDIFPSVDEQVNLNCSQSFPTDPFFKTAFENLGVDYAGYITALCNHYQLGHLIKDTDLIKEILYLLNQLSSKYIQSSYDEIISFFSNTAEYDVYTVLLVFNRILRTHFNQYILKDEVNYVLNYFTTLIIIYLVFNMFLEIIIFFILNFFIIKHIKTMNKQLTLFITSVKF